MLDSCARCTGTWLEVEGRKQALVDGSGVIWTREELRCRRCGFADVDFVPGRERASAEITRAERARRYHDSQRGKPHPRPLSSVERGERPESKQPKPFGIRPFVWTESVLSKATPPPAPPRGDREGRRRKIEPPRHQERQEKSDKRA